MPSLLSGPIPPLRRLWALVTPAGLYVLASIGPTAGAVMGWIEREKRRGLAILKDGFRIRPVIMAYDPSRADDERAANQAADPLRRVGR